MKEYPRKLRINTQVQHELAELIRDELSDPRVKGVTVTAADVAPDLRQAKISVSLLGSDEALEQAVQALNHATGKLRHELGLRLRLRHVPNLRFVADRVMREADRINQLIRKARAEDERHIAKPDDV